MNQTNRAKTAQEINFFRTSKLRQLMGNSEAGRRVLAAADSDQINLTFVAENRGTLQGSSFGNNANVYVGSTQNGVTYEILNRKISGYMHTANVAIHEGMHALGVAGSRRAEALVRLAEIANVGIPIDRKSMKQVLSDMGTNYDQYEWRIGRKSETFPELDF